MSSDTVFESEGTNIICTPFRAPNANSFAERWLKTLRDECFDNFLVVNGSHLRRVLTEHVEYYNSRRHRKVPGGIINDYFRIPEDNAVSIS